MNTSKDLICLSVIEKTLELIYSLKSQQNCEELNDIWNNLLEIRDRQIEVLEEHDQFKLLDRFKRVNLDVKEIETQTNVTQQQHQYTYESNLKYGK